MHIVHYVHIYAYLCICFIADLFFQPSFVAGDVPYRSLPTLSKDVLQAMMPDVKIYEADLKEGGHPTSKLPKCAILV